MVGRLMILYCLTATQSFSSEINPTIKTRPARQRPVLLCLKECERIKTGQHGTLHGAQPCSVEGCVTKAVAKVVCYKHGAKGECQKSAVSHAMVQSATVNTPARTASLYRKHKENSRIPRIPSLHHIRCGRRTSRAPSRAASLQKRVPLGQTRDSAATPTLYRRVQHDDRQIKGLQQAWRETTPFRVLYASTQGWRELPESRCTQTNNPGIRRIVFICIFTLFDKGSPRLILKIITACVTTPLYIQYNNISIL